MIFRQRQPCAPLSKFIDGYWFYQDLAVDHTKEKLLPNGAIELIIDLSPSPKKLYDPLDLTRFTTFRRAWISGMQRRFIVIGAERGSSMMGVHFHTGGAAPFFGFPISEITASVIELDLIWKREVYALRDRLLEEADISRKFDILEKFLLAKSRGNLDGDSTVEVALSALRRWPVLPLRELAARIGISQKKMISRFDSRVGCTPKLAARIFRFQRALEAAYRVKDHDWAELAQHCGYYDQSHFIHEFQEFAGMTAAEYVRRRTEFPDYIYLD